MTEAMAKHEGGRLSLRANDPVDFAALGPMIGSAEALKYVWPNAKWPLEPGAWHDHMARYPGSCSYFICLQGNVVGHSAILSTTARSRRHLAWIYLRPEFRGGRGRELVTLLINEARARWNPKVISLVTNTFNPRAQHLYRSIGFLETLRTADKIEMQMDLV